MLAQYGSFHTIEMAATTLATGTVRTGVSSMTINGIMTTTGTRIAGTKTTASTKAGTKKLIPITIATKNLRSANALSMKLSVFSHAFFALHWTPTTVRSTLNLLTFVAFVATRSTFC